jgi:hypothetical protein
VRDVFSGNELPIILEDRDLNAGASLPDVGESRSRKPTDRRDVIKKSVTFKKLNESCAFVFKCHLEHRVFETCCV